MGQFADGFVRLVARQATEQGGIISGDNPTHYNPKNPLRLWVIQVGIIVLFTQLLSLGLRRIRQPRVIAEVIGGVLLGPTVMGRIPHFTNRIFPQESIPLLSLTANIGLVFFLFLVGLEIDTRVIKRNAKASITISVVGLVIPLGLGAALAVPLYHEFIADTVNFGYFVLFVAVAIGITAFPVLCRILTELRLLDSVVGVVTLSAGVGNDVVGWVLLALVVTLVNSSGGLTALYVLLAAAGYVIVVLFPVRWAFHWLARKTGCLESGVPSTFMMTLTLLLVLVSALFTDVIGIHAIFGGFIAGLIIPHEGGFAIALVEKLEDLITLIFLPIYFTLSGLNTNLGLLDNGKTWGYTILICVIAFVSKFFGCAITAKLFGFNWRESGAIGTLMSCKGLVELIVLNIGLQAQILDTRTFSMFVLHALVLTFITTPLTLVFYPPQHRKRAADVGAPKETPDMVPRPSEGSPSGDSDDILSWKSKFAMVFNKVEHLPALMSMTQLLQAPFNPSTTHLSSISELASGSEPSEKDSAAPSLPTFPQVSAHQHASTVQTPLTIQALRLVELTERTSAVLRSQEASEPELAARDAVLAVFRTFASLHRVVIRAALRVVSAEEFSGTVATFASDGDAQMVVVPWAAHAGSGGTLQPLEEAVATPAPNNQPTSSASAYNPFENLFGKSDGHTAVARAQFVRKVFMESPVDVALYVDRTYLKNSVNTGFAVPGGVGHHVFLPFFGGPDDRLALSFVIQLCANPLIAATVVRIKRSEDEGIRDSVDEAKMLSIPQLTVTGTVGPDTVYGHNNTQTRLVSDTADNILWNRCVSPDGSVPQQTRQALRRITFTERSAIRPLRTAIELANSVFRTQAHSPEGPAPMIVVGRGRRMATESHKRELVEIVAERGPGSVGNEVAKAMGDIAAGFIASGTEGSILVLQANSMTVGAA